jgi:hypothetical protein
MIAWNRYSKAGLVGQVCGRRGGRVVFVFVLRSYLTSQVKLKLILPVGYVMLWARQRTHHETRSEI